MSAHSKRACSLCFAASLVVSVVLSILAQPPFDQWLLGYVSLAPWLACVRTTAGGGASGLLLGTLIGLGVGAWVPAALRSAGLGENSSLLIWALTCAGVRGLPMACLGFVAGLSARASLHVRLFTCAGTVFLCEWIVSWSPAGGPWALLGHSQWSTLPIAQLAALAGVPLVSAVLIASNVLFARALRDPRVALRHPRAVLAAGAALGGLALAGELVASQTRAREESATETLRLLAVQLVTPPGERWNKDLQAGHLQTALEAARRALASASAQADVLVLSETVMTTALERDPTARDELVRFAGETGIPLLLGIARLAPSGAPQRYRNGVVLVEPDGRLLDGPDKAAGVPFLEADPQGPWRLLAPLVGANLPGPRIEPGESRRLRVGSLDVGVVTCFEILFPRLVASRAPRGAPIVYLADDSWSTNPAMAEQALAAATFRAIENRSVVVRVAGSGVSAVIGPDGSRRQSLPFRQHGSIEAVVAHINPSAPVQTLGRLGTVLLGAWRGFSTR